VARRKSTVRDLDREEIARNDEAVLDSVRVSLRETSQAVETARAIMQVAIKENKINRKGGKQASGDPQGPVASSGPR